MLITRVWSLGAADRRLLFRAFAGIIVVDLRLRFSGLQRSLRWTELTRGSRTEPGAVERANRYAEWIARVARHHFIRARCLHQSLLLQRWLSQDDVSSDLRIGVAKADDTLHAHAWVEVDGRVVNDVPEAVRAFAPLANAAGISRAQSWR